MSLVEVRKFATVVEEVFHEGGPLPARPLKQGACLAVIRNPYAGGYVADILPLMKPQQKERLGTALQAAIKKMFPEYNLRAETWADLTKARGEAKKGPAAVPSYDVHGSGDRVLVLVHGLLMNRRMYDALAPEIASRGNRVVTVDLLGHGRARQSAVGAKAAVVAVNAAAHGDGAVYIGAGKAGVDGDAIHLGAEAFAEKTAKGIIAPLASEAGRHDCRRHNHQFLENRGICQRAILAAIIAEESVVRSQWSVAKRSVLSPSLPATDYGLLTTD